MHFQVSRQLRESPDVKIFFHGLLTFSPEPGGGCFIGVHNKSADHFFSVEVTVDEQPPHPNLPLLRLAGPLKSQLEITTDSPTTGVKKFVPNDYLFDRAVENHPNDFRWTSTSRVLNFTITNWS